MAASVSEVLALSLSGVQVYALFFLLGSFTVATVSDIKHLAAQREFVEVWFAFTAVVFALDLAHAEFQPGIVFFLKWLAIVALSVLSHRRVGAIFKLATGDVAACMAAASLLPFMLVLVFFALLKLLSIPLASMLSRGRGHYPFMPVVTAATVGLLVTGFAFAGGFR